MDWFIRLVLNRAFPFQERFLRRWFATNVILMNRRAELQVFDEQITRFHFAPFVRQYVPKAHDGNGGDGVLRVRKFWRKMTHREKQIVSICGPRSGDELYGYKNVLLWCRGLSRAFSDYKQKKYVFNKKIR
jgi:hypothetical protein